MLPNYRDIIDLMKKGSTLEAQEKIMELREGALELQEKNQQLQEENRQLRTQIASLESISETKGKPVYDKPSYKLVDEDQRDGPFCQKCQDDNERLIRLQGRENDLWRCAACNTNYQGPKYTAPQINRRPTNWKAFV